MHGRSVPGMSLAVQSYCNYEFFIDIDENKTEIECPECKNSIELDWGAENGEDGNHSCHGDCHGCHGCSDEDDDM